LKNSIGGARIEVSVSSDDEVAIARKILTDIGSSDAVLATDGRTLTVPVDNAPAALAAALGELGTRGIAPLDAGMRRPTLDDVFLQLTGHAATLDETPEDGDNPKVKKRARRERKAAN
jgi:ABC-2 type transport system ATP-binding protein